MNDTFGKWEKDMKIIVRRQKTGKNMYEKML